MPLNITITDPESNFSFTANEGDTVLNFTVNDGVGPTGATGPAPSGTGLVSVTSGVLDTPSTLRTRVAADAANLRTDPGCTVAGQAIMTAANAGAQRQELDTVRKARVARKITRTTETTIDGEDDGDANQQFIELAAPWTGALGNAYALPSIGNGDHTITITNHTGNTMEIRYTDGTTPVVSLTNDQVATFWTVGSAWKYLIMPESSGTASIGPQVKSANFTAANDAEYIVNASATVTDPSPVVGKGFTVFVRNGTATIGGTGYSTAGTIIKRTYHSGAWSNEVYRSAGNILSADIADASAGGNGGSDSGLLSKYGNEGNLTGASLSLSAVKGVSSLGTGLEGVSGAGDYHATFGNSGDDRSFVSRVLGSFGWWRGAYTGILRAASTLTGNRVYLLPDANTSLPIASYHHTLSGPTAARTYTLPDADAALARIDAGQTFAGPQVFSSTTRPTSGAVASASPPATAMIMTGDGDLRYGESVYVYKTSDTSRSSTVAFSDDPHLLLALAAGTWKIEAMQAWQAADGTGGMKARINYTGTWTTADSWANFTYFYSASGVSDTNAFTGYTKGSAMANPQSLLALTFRSGYIYWNAVIKVTNSGNLSLQWAQNASSATATVLPQGAYLIAKRIA